MKAVVWHGRGDVRVETVPDPSVVEPTDAVIRVTSTGLCGSDLHLYDVLAPFMTEGDILGHEPMGIVEAVGSAVTNLTRGIVSWSRSTSAAVTATCASTGCSHSARPHRSPSTGHGAALFGYTKLYGRVAGGQAELLRVPHADYGPIKLDTGPADDRFLFLSDVLPTAWQAVEYASIPDGGTVVVLGLGPIGDMATRIAHHRGHQVIGVDLVAERLQRVRGRGIDAIDLSDTDAEQLVEAVRARTGGRGPDAVIDAVGMEAHGSPAAKAAQKIAGFLPDRLMEKLMPKAGVDRLAALHTAIQLVRRGGVISVIGVYGGQTDPLPMLTMFDKQVTLRMGQANVRRWIDDILPLLGDDDPLGVDSFATHHLPLEQAPDAYKTFRDKRDGAVKIVFQP